MGEKEIVLVIVLLNFIGLLQVTSALTCYYCTNDLSGGSDSLRPYDADCGRFDYDDNTQEADSDNFGCSIIIYNTGYISRSIMWGGNYQDGDCVNLETSTQCYCEGDYCNTNSYCTQCGVTLTTPIVTEPTTESTTKIITSNTETTSLTSTKPSGGLKCYQCIACDTVDDSTPVVSDETYRSCVTTAFLNSAEVIRGGNYDEHPDGECAQHTESLSCWCTSDICNDKVFGRLQELLDSN